LPWYLLPAAALQVGQLPAALLTGLLLGLVIGAALIASGFTAVLLNDAGVHHCLQVLLFWFASPDNSDQP